MVTSHVVLVKIAKQTLREKGLKDTEIYKKFGFKNYRIDAQEVEQRVAT